jgi:DNA primase
LNPTKHKYDNLKGQTLHLYNVVHTTKPKVWLCEGEFDSLILTQMGFPAVGIPGASGFKPDWKYLFCNCEQVSLVFDSDEAGEKGAQRIASILGEVVLGDLRLIRLPEGLDVNDCYLRDPEELRELVS